MATRKAPTLKSRHFKTAHQNCSYGFGWVTNGHWCLRLDGIANGAVFSGDPEVVAAALDIKAENVHRFESQDMVERIVRKVGGTVPFRVSSLEMTVESRWKPGTVARLAFSEAGAPLALDSAYCDLLGISAGDTIAATVNGAAFSSADADEVRWVLMPVRMDSDTLARELGESTVKALAETFAAESGTEGGAASKPAAPSSVMDWESVRAAMLEASELARGAASEGRSEFAAFAARKAARWGWVLSLRERGAGETEPAAVAA